MLGRFAVLVRHAGRQHGLPAHLLDEVVQEVRIRLWRTLESGEKIRGVPASYVYRTAVSAALDLIRRSRTRRSLACGSAAALEPLVDGAARPEAALEHAETCRAIERAIEQLVVARRVPVRMHLAGYAREEMAELLGWTEARTRNLLYRGLADLRELLSAPERLALEDRCRMPGDGSDGTTTRTRTRVGSRSTPCSPSSRGGAGRASGSTCSTT